MSSHPFREVETRGDAIVLTPEVVPGKGGDRRVEVEPFDTLQLPW